ncbi:MAG: formylglycine-generating enzyme family protein [Rhodobacteraceae bacterium]|nr:formylglycine-generating enzyme family protein [Paracoccaceae bacterium]
MTDGKPCCQVARNMGHRDSAPQVFTAQKSSVNFDTALIPGGKAIVGTAHPHIADDGESPLRSSRVRPFRMGMTAVTNAQFQAFVAATGYVTEAEGFAWSFVFWSDVAKESAGVRRVPGLDWWRAVEGADWRNSHGPKTDSRAWQSDHPVSQVSWADARAYASWVGGRLPTEVEWEHAARGGLGDVKYPWGDSDPDDVHNFRCNIWQGQFPQVNTATDGYRHTAPAQSFEANGFGLYNMVGNVWEWTADRFTIKSLKASVKTRLAGMKGYRLSKGGSFLCHQSYCFRYRIAARSGSSPDSATPHQGFRMVWDV